MPAEGLRAPGRASSILVARPAPARRWRNIGALLLYLLIALAILWPYRSAKFHPTGDLYIVVPGIVEARNALREGQFPIRVTPNQVGKMRYPFFQYYGNFPFTAGGLLCLVPGVNAYTAWKVVTLLALVCGAWFTHRLAYWTSHHWAASVLAGAAFITAPYVYTDLHARGAFAELIAFMLVPAAVYCSLRAFVSRRWRYVPACAVAWALVALTHNITYMYAVLFTGLLIASFLRPDGKSLARLARLACGGALHALLVLWYVVPQFYTVNQLQIHGDLPSPYPLAVLNPLSILLSPVRRNNAAGASTPTLGLQVGWPILGGVVMAGAALSRRRNSRFRYKMIVRLLALFMLAFFMVWSPFDFWRYLPRTLYFVQFPYRILVFVVLWGAVLLACGLAVWFGRRFGPALGLLVLVLLGAASISYLPPKAPEWPKFVRLQMANPDMGAVVVAYLLAPVNLPGGAWTGADPTVAEWESHVIASRSASAPAHVIADKSRVRYGKRVRYTFTSERPVQLELPVLYYPRLLDVRDNGRRRHYGHVGHFVTLDLAPGRHRIAVRLVGVEWANILSGIGWGAVAMICAAAAGRRLLRATPLRPGRRADNTTAIA